MEEAKKRNLLKAKLSNDSTDFVQPVANLKKSHPGLIALPNYKRNKYVGDAISRKRHLAKKQKN